MKGILKPSRGKLGVVLLTALVFAGVAFSQEPRDVKRVKEMPPKGISVTLVVFSGRPNPHWWVTKGEELKSLVSGIESMSTSKEPLFNYAKWNRLGYATFYVRPREIKGMPYRIHIWRDEAYVLKDKKGPGMYAKGVSEIYDMLVAQAEKRGHREFFLKYHESKPVE